MRLYALLGLCCVVSAAALIVSLRPPAPAPGPVDPRSVNSGLETRIAKLEEAVHALQQHAVESATATEQRDVASDAPTAADRVFDERLRAIEDWVNNKRQDPTFGPDSDVSTREIERTRQALDVIEREEMKQQVNRWIAQEQQKVDTLATMIGNKLNLSEHEHDTLTEILAQESAGQGKLMQELWDPDPDAPTDERQLAEQWDAAVAHMKKLRAERDIQLEELLGEERFAKAQRLAKQAGRAGGRDSESSQR